MTSKSPCEICGRPTGGCCTINTNYPEIRPAKTTAVDDARKPESKEMRYYRALRRIKAYQSPDCLRRDSQKDWALAYEDALEYAYENIQQEAANALRGQRRPKL